MMILKFILTFIIGFIIGAARERVLTNNKKLLTIVIILTMCSCNYPKNLSIISGCEQYLYKIRRDGTIINPENPVRKVICDTIQENETFELKTY